MKTKLAPQETQRVNVAYLRVSTDGQEEGNGLDSQRQAIAAFAATQGVSVDLWLEDVISGAKEERPALDKVRVLASEGKLNQLLIFKLDRFARDTRVALNLEHELKLAGARVISVSEHMGEGPVGDMMRTIMFAFATFERAQIAARTKAGRRIAVERKGTYAGGSGVLGYRPVGKRGDLGHGVLAVQEGEAASIRMIFALKAEGHTLSAIAASLNEAGHVTVQGSQFTKTQVHRVLARESFYRAAGVITRSVETAEAAHMAILGA